MKVVELLKLLEKGLKEMTRHDVLRDDWRYVGMYEQYQALRLNRVKHLAAIEMLAEEYEICTRTVERVIKRLKREVGQLP